MREKNRTARVRPGVAIWLCVVTACPSHFIDHARNAHGVDRRIFPNTFPSTTVCNLFSPCRSREPSRFTTTDGRTDIVVSLSADVVRTPEVRPNAIQHPPFHLVLTLKCMSDGQSAEIRCHLFHSVSHPLFPKPSQGPILPSHIRLTFRTVYPFHVRISHRSPTGNPHSAGTLTRWFRPSSCAQRISNLGLPALIQFRSERLR
jgi:hypothetical protein